MLLNDCHKVKILATSREPAPRSGRGDVSGAVALRAADSRLRATERRRGASVCPYVTIALFVERAQAVDHRFTLTDKNAPVIADICRRLDGSPLAIELAAARVKMLSLRELRDRLDERFRILTGGGRGRLPRHQTLRALIDWSHDLLDECEQRLFRRLSIFANGFTLEAASVVGGGDEFDAFEMFDLLASLESLVQKSLMIADPTDSVRYRLLESTRFYAVEKLVEAGEREALASRHLRHFRDWFVELRRQHDQLPDGLDAALATELDDLRVAIDSALMQGESLTPEAAIALARA